MSKSFANSKTLNSRSEELVTVGDQRDYPTGSAVKLPLEELSTVGTATFEIGIDIDSSNDRATDTDHPYTVTNDRRPPFSESTTRQTVTIAFVGPSELLREGFSRILDTKKFRILFSAASMHEFLKKPSPHPWSLLLILDVGGADADAEFAQIAEFKAIYPTSHVVVLADHCRSADIISAFHAGADGYLTKVAAYDTFMKALELVTLGQTVLPSEASKYIPEIRRGLKERDLSILSTREKCILRCLIEGESNKAIAREINIAEATVKVHVKAILRKIRVSNRTQAAVWAMNHSALPRHSMPCPQGK